MMKRFIWLVPAFVILLCCAPAQAQTPEWEVAGGYSYFRANLGGPSFQLNGIALSAGQNLNNWFGGRLEVNIYQGTPFGTNVNAQTLTYGPVFSYRRLDRITPFAHVQLGAIHASQGYLGISQSAWRLAVAPGVGVDVKIDQRLALRLQGDYVLTDFLALRQDNAQISAGLVFRFGSK